MINFNFSVNFLKISDNDKCPCVNIDGDEFSYGNIYGMYNTDSTQGHGIQVDNPKIEQALLKMCDKIAQAVYDYQEEAENVQT
jgi:hypothetical protein